MFRTTLFAALFAGALLIAGCQTNAETKEEIEAAQSEVRTMSRDTLAKLESIQPGARRAVESAYGHAEFANFGMKLGVVGSGSGKGLAVRNSPREETFMRMAELQAGLGFGAKKFRLVWVFTTQAAFDTFVNKGWEFGAQATAQAQANDKGGSMAGAVSVGPGVYLYQITDDGLALELTAKGTKYYKDDSLN